LAHFRAVGGQGRFVFCFPVRGESVMQRFGAALLWACLVSACGCGGSRFSVSTVEGSVTVDGAPIPAGQVIFSPLASNTGQPVSTEISQGKYRCTRVPRGALLVHISAFEDRGDKHVEFGITYPKLTNLVPEKYHSGIELNVDAPTLTHNFELASK
jgi:hypothetical protein